jgi:predicted alpha-1,2-mannosidase
VELTCSPHVAVHRYTFEGENPRVYIDFQNGNVSSEDLYNTRVLAADIKNEGNMAIIGKMRVKHWVERDLYFVINFDNPFISADTIEADSRNKAPKIVYGFDLKKKKELKMKIAFSMVSVDGAKNNMTAEAGHWNFNKIRRNAENEWDKYLSRIQIEGSPGQKKNFYTSLYHLLIQPNNIADVDGRYRGADDSTAISPFKKYYSTFSLWDTFRAAHPMYTIVVPDRVPDIINTMLLHADTYGHLPVWTLWGKENYCMIGNHGVAAVVEACMKDIPGIDMEKAYRLVRKSLTENHYRSEWDIYDEYGYFPFDLIKEESVSRTLEGGYDDYCAARLAEKLGKKDDYEFFMKRSGYYKNLLDPGSKLMRAKDSKGMWRTPFDKFHLSHAGTAGGDYTEGNAWQYTWHVLQDINGLVDLMGGKEKFITKLDSLFILDVVADATGFTGDVTGLIGQYAQGNEPGHHVIYLYSMLGENARTAELVCEVFDKFYKPKADGLCGNDDCGQMSAWYMFGALGFYPVDPVSAVYIIGAPQVPKATINLADGKKFTMIARNLSGQNKYVKTVKLNGLQITDAKITHRSIMQGGILEFEMTDKP